MTNFKREILKFILGKHGFTFAEVIIATIIMLLVLGGVISVYFMISNLNDIETVKANGIREAHILMERLIRGVTGNNGLREAVSFVINSPSDISFTIPDGQPKRFYLSNNSIYYGPSNEVIGNNIGSLNFSGTSKFVDIIITFSKIHRGRVFSFQISEAVKARN